MLASHKRLKSNKKMFKGNFIATFCVAVLLLLSFSLSLSPALFKFVLCARCLHVSIVANNNVITWRVSQTMS